MQNFWLKEQTLLPMAMFKFASSFTLFVFVFFQFLEFNMNEYFYGWWLLWVFWRWRDVPIVYGDCNCCSPWIALVKHPFWAAYLGYKSIT
jgi:hypothetical protein